MSRIFEALQRAQAEYSEIDLSSETAEMLQRSERRTSLNCGSRVLSEPYDATKSVDNDTSFDRSSVPTVEMVVEAPTAVEPLPADERLGLFAQIKSRQVLPTPQSRLPCLTDSGSPAAEAFRLLGVRMRHLRRDRALKKVLITSTIPQEGKSMVAANLACTLALRTQQRILMLEGDLRRPSLSRMFGLGKNPGLSEYLYGEGSLTTGIYHLEDANLWILPAGSTPSNALELLQSGKLSTLMDQLTVLFDWIIIDSPPVLPLADTSVWMRLADGILLTTRQGTTDKRQLQRGLEAIETKKLLGALVNSSNNASTSDYYYRPTTI